jgi:hypothetical protein
MYKLKDMYSYVNTVSQIKRYKYNNITLIENMQRLVDGVLVILTFLKYGKDE